MKGNKAEDYERVPDVKNTWEKAKPEKLPAPTYWPFFLAMGLTFTFWGFLTTWVILLAGLIILIIALIGWINTIRNGRE